MNPSRIPRRLARALALVLLVAAAAAPATPVLFSQAGGSAFLKNISGGSLNRQTRFGTGSAEAEASGTGFSYNATVTTAERRNRVAAEAEGCARCIPEIVATSSGLSRFQNSVLAPPGSGTGTVRAHVDLKGELLSDSASLFYSFEFDSGDELGGSFTNHVDVPLDTTGRFDIPVELEFDFDYRFSRATPITYTSELSLHNDGNATATLRHLSFISMSVIEEPEPASLDIVLDWHTPLPRAFDVLTDEQTGAQTVVPTPGQEVTVNDGERLAPAAFQAFQQGVAEQLEAIFEASDIDLRILSPTDSGAADALTVRFGQEEPYQDADGALEFLHGAAFDVGPEGLPYLDRFNARHDGMVAVFLDLDVATTEFTAEIIAHESGHGFGLRHVDPDAGSALEVMNYTHADGDTERFTDRRSNILEPPNVADDSGRLGTHNPVYHLRRYGLGHEHSDLLAEGVRPGTWDLGQYSLQRFNLLTVDGAGLSLGDALYNMTAVNDVGAGADALEQAFDTLLYRSLVDLTGAGGFSFLSAADFPFRIFASSAPGSVWDLYFGFGDPANPDLLFDPSMPGPVTGTVFRSLGRGLGYEAVGSFTASLDGFAIVTEDGEIRLLASVPEPPAVVLMVAAGVALLGVGWGPRGRDRRLANPRRPPRWERS